MKNKKFQRIFPSAASDAARAKKNKDSNPQVASPSYRLAFDDQDFLLREEMRPLRMMLELSKPEIALDEHGVRNTVVVFGSARTSSPEQAEKNLQSVEKQLQKKSDDEALLKQLKKAQAQKRQSLYYQQARELAQIISRQSCLPDIPELHVITGGGPGIMEAANRGAADADGKSIGLNIVLPREQYPNSYTTPELSFRFHYFAMRKMHFLLRARVIVVFPGGFGTLDELFEALTLVQTKKIKQLPILLFGKNYWQRLINFEVLEEEGMIDADDMNYFHFVETATEAWDVIADYLHCSPAVDSE